MPLIGSVPFTPELREGGDEGVPIVLSDPSSPASVAFNVIAEKLILRSKSLVGVRLGLA